MQLVVQVGQFISAVVETFSGEAREKGGTVDAAVYIWYQCLRILGTGCKSGVVFQIYDMQVMAFAILLAMMFVKVVWVRGFWTRLAMR